MKTQLLCFKHFVCVRAKPYAALTLLSLPITSTALAEQTNDVENISITGSRLNLDRDSLAVALTVLDSQDIKQSGALQITDLLRGLPGITLAQSGSIGSLTEIRVRGSESNHVLVLVDGVIVNDEGQGGLIDLAHLTSANVSRIEYTRGPQSALWGSGAIGGVISITTVASANVEQTRLAIAAGTQNTRKISIGTKQKVQGVRVGAYVDAHDTDGENISRQGDEDDGYQNVTAGISVNSQLNSSHTITGALRATEYTSEFDGIDFVSTGLPSDADNETDGSQRQAHILWQYAPQNAYYSSSLQVSARQDKNDNVNGGSNTGGTTGERLQATWLNTFDLSNDWKIAAGIDWLQRLFEQRGLATNFGDPNQTQDDNTKAFMLEASGPLNSAVNASFSIRYENNSVFDNATSWRSGLTYQHSPSILLFLSAGQAVKTPTFTERFGFFADTFIGNPALKPEHSRDLELGMSWQISEKLTMDASWFKSDLRDEINGFVFDATSGAFTAQNSPQNSQREGVDFTLSTTVPYARLLFTYGYLDASEDNGDMQQTELRRARHQGAISLYSDLKNSAWSAYAKLAYTGSREDTFFAPGAFIGETVGLRAYTLMSINVSYQYSPDWQINVRADNALNADFEDVFGFQGRPASFVVSLNYAL